MASPQSALSPQQLRHYSTFGFITLPQLLSGGEMQALTAEFEQKLDRVYAHRPFDNTDRHWSGQALGDDTPLLLGLTEDPRFYGAARQFYGEDVILAGADGNRYTEGYVEKRGGDSGLTHWHPDHGTDVTQDCYGVKMVFYLDKVDGDSGALR
eukprot:SAG22_NODE_1806_length_3531_cov_2.206294_1_plen_153_part_00